jgi:hypothetical protein
VTDATVPAPRERGWLKPLLALAAFVLFPLVPVAPGAAPVGQTMLLLVPAVAACALAAWRNGGRFSIALIWTALAVWIVAAGPAGASPGSDLLTRGWAVLLAATFGAICLMPSERGFFDRAVLAIATTGAVALIAIAVTPQGGERVASLVRDQYTAGIAPVVTFWEQLPRGPEWRDMAAGNPALALYLLATRSALLEMFATLPDLATRLLPSLLGLESMAALALGWALYHRLGRARLGPPLSPLREFRFADHFVWGIVGALAILFIPMFAPLRTIGLNLLVFFGSLYLLRGLGVAMWFARAPALGAGRALHRIAMVWLALLAVLFLPVSGSVAFAVGLGDTWADWRRMNARQPT